MAVPKELKPNQLYTRCSTADLNNVEESSATDPASNLGQERALEALKFGISIKRDGYNIFAHGAPGTRKHTLVRQHLEAAAAAMPPPEDWCYVNNFDEPYKPNALSLPAGRGNRLRSDMETLIQELRATIPTAFEGEDYQARVQAIRTEFAEQHEAAFNVLQEHASAKNVALIRTPAGLALAPTSKGEVVNPDVFRQ